ncbi:Ras GTPase [Apiospora aurea]|uniref:Ras GTPase n=1 Tax=Apiospora aurea TaxID=335848 RepID=A0ABR1PT20_9PEZI
MDSHSVDRLIFWVTYHTFRGPAASAILFFICALSFAVLLHVGRRRIRYSFPQVDLEKGYIICSSAEYLPRSEPVLSEKTALPCCRNEGRHNTPLISLWFCWAIHASESRHSWRGMRTANRSGHVTLEIKDTAGIDSYHTLRDEAIRNGNCFMLVFDVRKKASFDYLEPIAANIRSRHGDKWPILFVGNWASENDYRTVTKEKGKELAQKFGGEYMELSESDDVGVVFSAALPQRNKGLRALFRMCIASIASLWFGQVPRRSS